jgi:hypothetical protein
VSDKSRRRRLPHLLRRQVGTACLTRGQLPHLELSLFFRLRVEDICGLICGVSESGQHGTLRSYPGLPHGMPTAHADQINADLLAFIRS